MRAISVKMVNKSQKKFRIAVSLAQTARALALAPSYVVTRAHNLCHDNRQLIVIAINRNRLAIKINCN